MTHRIPKAALLGLTMVFLTPAISLAAAPAVDQDASFVLEMKGARAAFVVAIDGLTAGNETSARGSIVLKGLRASGALHRWVRLGRRAAPETLTILLKNTKGEVLGGWRIRNASPIKWEGPSLEAKSGTDVPIETLELAHEGIEPIY
jgi:hypothetical protein